MSAYLAYARVGYRVNLAYRGDLVAGVLQQLLAVVASVAIWRAVYGSAERIDGTDFSRLATYIVLAQALRTLHSLDDFFVEDRIHKGVIGTDLLRPVHLGGALFSFVMGGIAFRMVAQVAPVLVVGQLLYGLTPPASLAAASLGLLSAALGLLVLYHLDLLVWTSAFWIRRTWSLVTIKDALVQVLSGAVFPVWFMPRPLRVVLAWTPFDAILNTPISIYLGHTDVADAGRALLRQALWAVLLAAGAAVVGRRAVQTATIDRG